MKFILVLAALASVAFALEKEQVTCLPNGQGIAVSIGVGDYTDYKNRAELLLGSCPVGADGSVEAGANCGIQQEEDGTTLIFKAELTSAPPSDIITRKKPVAVTVACTYDTVSSQSSSSFINPNLGEIVGDIKLKGELTLTLTLLDADGNAPADGTELSVNVGDKVKALVGGAGAGMKARATKCWATPAADTTDPKMMYTIMDNSCGVDDTFSSSENGATQLLMFVAFAFSHNTGSSVYLHCDLVACASDKDCGTCGDSAGGDVNPRRRRRAIKMKKSMQYQQKNKIAQMHVTM